jgi:predicted RNA-binding Zn-ribbon protein involved in translation (DUF1610 family)
MKSAQKWGEDKMTQPLGCKLDLTRIEGNGDFPCPNCGVTISPEDETEVVYQILETKVKGETLEELVIQCNKCASQICLTGFSTLETGNP